MTPNPFPAVLIGFLIAALGTWLMVRFAPQLHLVDLPNERSSHVMPTPRGGGLALVIAITIGALLLPGPLPLSIAPALWAALPIALVGLIDDRRGLSARVRLACHLLAALACVLMLVRVAPLETHWPHAVLVAGSVIAIAWGTNLFNFMDGIDGIASMEAIFVAGAGALLLGADAPPVAAALWVIVAACAGFLLWNWAPARIFMGDVGSGFFGFLLAGIAVLTVLQGLMGLPVWLILWGTFIADTGVTLARRMLRGERWWSAHRSHAYQNLSRGFASHAASTLVYAAINLVVLAPLAWLAHVRTDHAWTICGLTLLGLVIAAVLARAGATEMPAAGGQ
ncbi:MAG: glycosyltransferase family 4 protein [Steroidobacteraceae bacterium]